MARTPRCPLDAARCRRQWQRAVGLVLPLAFALGACGAADPASKHGVSAVQFQDVVVPTGLRLVDDAHRSHSRDDAGYRHGHFEYVGQVDLQAAANYVRERMPQHGWSTALDEGGETATRMRFERGKYSADYSFTRSEGATIMVVDYRTDFAR